MFLPDAFPFVWQTTFPLPDGTAPYYGRFLVLADGLTATTLKYRMNAVPRVPGVKDTNPPSGYAVDGIFIGAGSVGFSTDGGSEAVAEGNRVFNTAIGGSYHDTWGTKDHTDRNNYYSNVTLGPFQNMGSSSALKLAASVNVTGASATITTTEEHGMVVGQAVRIASSNVGEITSAFYRINAVTAFTFSFDKEGVDLPGSYFAALWQMRHSVQENNVIELEDASHVGNGFGRASGLFDIAPVHGTGRKVFQSLIARANVVSWRPRESASLSPPRGIDLRDVDQAIVEDNAIDVSDVSPIFVNFSGPLYFSENISAVSGIESIRRSVTSRRTSLLRSRAESKRHYS